MLVFEAPCEWMHEALTFNPWDEGNDSAETNLIHTPVA